MSIASDPEDDLSEDRAEDEEDDDEDVAAGGRCPICEALAGECDHLVASIDLTYAEFVAGAVLSQALEFPSLPTLALEPLFKFYLAATNQVDAHPLCFSQIRIDSHILV